MKSYFILRDFLGDALKTRNVGIILHTYKVDGVETLTPQFFADTQGEETANPGETYDFCTVDNEGNNPVSNTNTPNSYNPFWYHFGTKYEQVNGLRRGAPVGTLNGNDYGPGVQKIGVDKPSVLTGSDGFLQGAFFIDIDFTKSLDISFDIVTSLIDGTVYENPVILKRYKISWFPEYCYKSFSFFSEQTQMTYNELNLGFLKGVTPDLAREENVSPFIDLTPFCTPPTTGDCPDKERTRSFAMFVNIPPADEVKDRIKECCYEAVVLAQPNGNDYEKNDFTGVYHKKQVASETADFFLVNVNDPANEIALDDDAYGSFKDFGSILDNPNLKTFVLSWAKVLQTLGVGTYTILKKVTIGQITYEEADMNFTLKPFSQYYADKTVRMDVEMNGFLERLQVDFVNSGFRTSLRYHGFFGRREPKYVEDNLVHTNYRKEQISMRENSEYTMQSNNLPFCMTSHIIDFMLLANTIYFNDYNFNNHNRNIVKFAVTLADNKGMGYSVTSTKAKFNLTFTEKKVDNIKRNY